MDTAALSPETGEWHTAYMALVVLTGGDGGGAEW